MLERAATTRGLFAVFVAFYVTATIALGFAAYQLSDRALMRQVEERVVAETGLLRHIHQHGGIGELNAALRRRDDRGVNALGYLLLDSGGRRIGGELNMPAAAAGWRTAQIADLEGTRFMARILTVVLPDGASLTVASETDPVERLRKTMVWLFTAGVLGMIAGGVGGAFLFSRQLRRNLDRMNDTALAIIGGDLTTRVPIGSRADEFDRLAATLNRMLDRNAALVDNLRRVSSDIAHDLRTPIAHLAQELEQALAKSPDVAVMNSQIEKALEQSFEILSLFAALLRISEIESHALRRYFTRFDLSETVRQIYESYEPVAQDSGHEMRLQIETELTVTGDQELIAQALVNLLENALRHSGPGTSISVHLKRDGGQAVLEVANNGRGVPPELIRSLTDRFVRGDKARHSPGFGLGLNLVRAIAEMHDANLILRSPPEGFEARIVFPCETTHGLHDN